MGRDEKWLIALDLSTPRGLVVLDGPGGTFQREVAGGSRVSHLFVAAREAMSAAGIKPAGLGLVGVGRGPGSFTGVRVAVTAAKVLAAVLETPLVAPDSLMVTAASADGGAEAVFAALDARRGEVYSALYRIEDGYPVALQEPCVAPPLVAAASLSRWMEREGAGVVAAGNGIEAYPDAWPKGMARAGGASPHPSGLARLCHLCAGRGEFIAPIALMPLYLRRPDVKERCGGGEGGGPC